ncbi:transcriptional regulator [Streptomyces boninensis]|uniref:transcriptional regulator n=1 Tax=Streptomyces boninensis TaxID=2039455 RepID=UPI003B22115F
MEPNLLFAAVLEEAGFSHAGLAARVNEAGRSRDITLRYDHASVLRWLRGQRPQDPVPEVLCEVFGRRLRRTVRAADIGLAGPRPRADDAAPGRMAALWQADGRGSERLLTLQPEWGPGALLPVWQWRRADALALGEEGDPRLPGAAREHYERMYRQVGGVATRLRVVSYLSAEVGPLLRTGQDGADGRLLSRSAGSLAALAGVCAYDSDLHGLAQRYFTQALRLSARAGDRPLGAYAIGLMAQQALTLRHYSQALACTDAALDGDPRWLSPALATDVYAMRAKAYAAQGDAASARAAARAAQAMAALIGSRAEPAETDYVERGRVEALLAETFLGLGELWQARLHAERAAAADGHTRGRVHRLAVLARVRLRQGEPEEAARLVAPMLAAGTGMESTRLRDRYRLLRRELGGYDAAISRSAVERIDEALRIPL